MNKLIEFFKEYGEELLVFTIPIAMVIFALILAYCNEPNREYSTDENNSSITIYTIDNHEYLVHRHAGGMCHKVDCKFCMAKNGKE